MMKGGVPHIATMADGISDMAVKTLVSCRFHLDDMDSSFLNSDMRCFNRIKRIATGSMIMDERRKKAEAASKKAEKAKKADKANKKADNKEPRIDGRTKEGRAKNKDKEPGLEAVLRKRFGIKSYYVHEAVVLASGLVKGTKELQKAQKDDLKDRVSQVKKKISTQEKRLGQLMKTKGCLIERSKARKAGKKRLPKVSMPQGAQERYDEQTGGFSVYRSKPGKGWELISTYKDDHCFEAQYLDPEIKETREGLKKLRKKATRLEGKAADDMIRIHYGSHDLWKQQHTKYADDENSGRERHEIWKRKFDLARNDSISIAGRADLPFGNAIFKYDVESHEMTYTTMSGRKIRFAAQFMYGQELIDEAVTGSLTLGKKDPGRRPISWSIERDGGAYILKCNLQLKEPEGMSSYSFDNGCVGMDMNVDRLAIADVTKDGNQTGRKVIYFDLRGLSSEQAEHVLSDKLDEVFSYCRERHKPLAMEELDNVLNTKMYGQKALNRVLSGFAYRKMTMLAESKSYKYGIPIKTVDPAYTSKSGKMKYMCRNGESIHESAAFTIGRRAMGLKERVPDVYRLGWLKAKDPGMPIWKQWRTLTNLEDIKELMTHDYYIDRRSSDKAVLDLKAKFNTDKGNGTDKRAGPVKEGMATIS